MSEDETGEARGPADALDPARRRSTTARREGAVAVAALALGAVALGALAVGAVAVGQLALGRMRLRSGQVQNSGLRG
jgi:hypothetical protein